VQQYSLKFPLQQSYSCEDYIVTEANREAHQLIMLKQPWGVTPYPYHLLLIGPKSSGKTHLAHLWSQKYGLAFIQPGETHGCIIDDVELWHEHDLLHLFNQFHEEHKPLLMTAKSKPSFNLPDLQSRMNSIRVVHLTMPDEEMIMVLLMRYLSVRSLKVSGEVVEYLASRIKRDFDFIRLFIEQLDAYSLDTGRNITIPLISKLLNNFDE